MPSLTVQCNTYELSTKPLLKKVSARPPQTRFQHYDDLCQASSRRENKTSQAQNKMIKEQKYKLNEHLVGKQV